MIERLREPASHNFEIVPCNSGVHDLPFTSTVLRTLKPTAHVVKGPGGVNEQVYDAADYLELMPETTALAIIADHLDEEILESLGSEDATGPTKDIAAKLTSVVAHRLTYQGGAYELPDADKAEVKALTHFVFTSDSRDALSLLDGMLTHEITNWNRR